MDYFRKVLVGPQEGGGPSGEETIERLVDRVQTSTLLDDRRDAVRALKSLSKKFRLAVGTMAMEILLNVLQTDRSDAEIVGYALDTLYNVTSNEPTEEEDENVDLTDDLGGQFTEILIKKQDNVSLLLSMLEEYDFHVRWPTVKLLTVLLTNRPKDLQEIILVSPMGVSKLMDLLSDSREIIRNDALLLLIQLTKNNANIQKIVAFENAFERLLEIINEEGGSDGGIVVEDCLLLLLNLLKNNTSNQNFFKEGSYIQHLPKYFSLESIAENPQGGWSAQKVTNIHLMLQLVRTLVSPNSPQQHVTSSQRAMYQCNLLQELCSILMASGVPADVLTETINTVSEVIRGNQINQNHFASVMAPSNPPRPAIVVLLMSMVNEKQPFVLRCAVLYCFQSFLYKNDLGKSQIISTLLPTSADVNAISAGQLLCGGLFSADSMSNWCAAIALLHAIVDTPTEKEQLLRVQLATSLGNPPVSLLQQCCNILAQGGKFQTRIGLLMLISVWLSDCPVAVTHFLHNSSNVPMLISQVSSSEGDEQEVLVQGLCAFVLGICVHTNNNEVPNFNKDSLIHIIERRIGLETYADKLSQVSKNESYNKAAKKPQPHYKQASEVVFDYAFTRLFKSLENEIVKAVQPESEQEKQKRTNLEQHANIVTQYKELIRDQDLELGKLRTELSTIQNEYSETRKTLEEMKQQVQQLKDQNSLLKAQKGIGNSSQNELDKVNGMDNEELSRLQQALDVSKQEIEDRDKQIEKLKNELTVAEAKVLVSETNQGEENGKVEPSDTAMLQATINRLTVDVDQLQKMLTEKDEEIVSIRNQYEEANRELRDLKLQKPARGSVSEVPDDENSPQVTEKNIRIQELEGSLTSVQEQNQRLTDEKTSLQERLKKANEDNLNLQEKYNKLSDEKTTVERDRQEKEEEVTSTKKEMEDLLVLLADQDTKLGEYRKKLRELGVKIEDEDEDDDDDDEDDVEDDDVEDDDDVDDDEE